VFYLDIADKIDGFKIAGGGKGRGEEGGGGGDGGGGRTDGLLSGEQI